MFINKIDIFKHSILSLFYRHDYDRLFEEADDKQFIHVVDVPLSDVKSGIDVNVGFLKSEKKLIICLIMCF